MDQLMDLNVLDCTLRDGGYYNNWDFAPDLVEKYLNSIALTGIQIAELGFRSFPRKGFHGPYAYTSDDFIAHLNIPDSLQIAVMVDAKTLLNGAGGSVKESIAALFAPSEQSRVEIVRVAAHFSQIDQCGELLKELRELGYIVGFNMMQSGSRSVEELENAAKAVSSWDAVDVLYFADSIGNMDEGKISQIVSALRTAWEGELGFHAHNNMGKANANCIKAIESGVSWIDSTMTGMGRGAGNAQSEILLNDLAHAQLGDFEAEPLYELALEYFDPMQKKMGWGANFAYHYSAMHGIHPSYAQELLSDQRYSVSDVVSTLQFLSKSDSASFDSELVQKALDEDYDYDLGGSWNAKDWCLGEDILILGAGPSLRKYSSAIERFIPQRSIKALSLNFHQSIPDELIYAFVAGDTKRLALDVKRYHHREKPMFTPVRFLHPDFKQELRYLDVRDYDLKVVPKSFKINHSGCEIPQRLTFAYAIGLCAMGGASRVFLVGFDGYSADDPRQAEMIETLEIIKETVGHDFMIALTPTTYPVTQGSIFAPY
jgi:4-hydroxy 2-oxovalerate aldolase